MLDQLVQLQAMVPQENHNAFMNWPAKSPDICAREPTWFCFEELARSMDTQHKTIQDLCGVINEEWENTTQETSKTYQLICHAHSEC